ncbi:group I truncated hemoglobin [Salisediminibacterium selenitireducens]|uniref:Group 1 truncated hemoglobin n=1 Tax=Bacillus selenitireducens (strain ATCC 700615 / DSM 15326 / MLS10) TaxID=439292 RepID=D6XZC8_BACIE|nr:group 1 truncated hemoglobin [Salisediminibacterium selenitireducens]ADI00413.1 globin [[Bacillus] selenitireducens MLS10]
MTTLYETLGEEAGIRKAVDRFYEKVLSDSTVSHYFTHTDMDKQREHQTKFLSFALGGPDRYGGPSMEKAHEGMNIQEHEFEAIATHLEQTLQELGADQKAIDEAVGKVVALKDSVIHQ